MAVVRVDEAWEEAREKALAVSRDGCGGKNGGTASVGMVGIEAGVLFEANWEDIWVESREGDGREEGGDEEDDITGIVGRGKVISGMIVAPEFVEDAVAILALEGIRDGEVLVHGSAVKADDQTEESRLEGVLD